MLTFVEFLEELERNHQAVTVPADELEQLVRRFGGRVRQMGRWNHTTDGSLEIPMGNIAEASKTLDDRQLSEAVNQLKNPAQFTDMNSSSAAARLIEVLSVLYLKQFEHRVLRYQESGDPSEVERLRHDISRELFGEAMPRMDWAALPRGIRDHLLDRARHRQISARDLAPDGMDKDESGSARRFVMQGFRIVHACG